MEQETENTGEMKTMENALAPPMANTGLSIFDSGTFEQMGMIASKLASSSLIPQSLRAEKKGQNWIALPPEQVAANCFRIVEQAQRWGMSPFAVIDCASVVHGKLMWEGKLVSAALEATMGIRLDYNYSGEGMNRKIIVSGRYPEEEKIRTIEGDVNKWKTDQWKATDYDQRLAYRGAREWARRHAPGVILGVYSPDEFNESELRDVTPKKAVVEVRDTPFDPFAGQQNGEGAGREANKGGSSSAGDVPAATPEMHPSQPAVESEGTQSADVPPSEEAAGSPLRPAFVVEVEVKSGNKKDGGKWTGYFVKLSNGEKTIIATTFSTRIGLLAQSAVKSNVMVELEKNDRGYTLADLQKEQEGGLI